MLDIHFIREHATEVEENAKKRLMEIDVAHLLKIDEAYRMQLQRVEELRQERNQIADTLKNTGKNDGLIARGRELKDELQTLDAELSKLQEERQTLLMAIPNMTHPDVPQGSTDDDHVEISRHLEPTSFDFESKDHVELSQLHDLLDFERAADVAGSGFYYKKNALAVMEIALEQFAFSVAMKHGYTPMITPDLARFGILEGTGYNPRGAETQIYGIQNTDLGLIATAEIPVAGYYANHVFQSEEIKEPVRIVALSHCFRTEDGAYGKESRGLYRVHQFSKVELFVFCRPEDSEAELQRILAVEEEIMQQLQIPYRVVDICIGDLGAPAYRKYDIEAWMPFKNGWGEVTSASNCTDYQARRLQIRCVGENGEKAFAHTLNGTAIANSRMPIAILENHQNADGSIDIPEVLHPWMLGITRIGS